MKPMIRSRRWRARLVIALALPAVALAGGGPEFGGIAMLDAVWPRDPRALEPIHVTIDVGGCRGVAPMPTLEAGVVRFDIVDLTFDADFCGVVTRHARPIGALPPGEYALGFAHVDHLGVRRLVPLRGDVDIRVGPPGAPAAREDTEAVEQVDYSGLWVDRALPSGNAFHLYSLPGLGAYGDVAITFQARLAGAPAAWTVITARRGEDGVFVGEMREAPAGDGDLRVVGSAQLRFENPDSGELRMQWNEDGAARAFALRRFRHR